MKPFSCTRAASMLALGIILASLGSEPVFAENGASNGNGRSHSERSSSEKRSESAQKQKEKTKDRTEASKKETAKSKKEKDHSDTQRGLARSAERTFKTDDFAIIGLDTFNAKRKRKDGPEGSGVFVAIGDGTVEDIKGTTVESNRGVKVGQISDLIVDGKTIKAVIGMGGFLGIGETRVALPLKAFNRSPNATVQTPKLRLKNYTVADLNALPTVTGNGVVTLSDSQPLHVLTVE